jgi:formylglycine-generating enzyme required for sulfatase activity
MSLKEAKLLCAALGKRLPTQREWELAARGVDGREFPWGDTWDPRRGNAGLPPEVGKPMRLRPSDSLAGSESPFGLIDVVGNAGEWIDDGEDQPVFMGCPYRFDVSTCKAYMLTKDTGDVLPRFEVTARCVSR